VKSILADVTEQTVTASLGQQAHVADQFGLVGGFVERTKRLARESAAQFVAENPDLIVFQKRLFGMIPVTIRVRDIGAVILALFR